MAIRFRWQGEHVIIENIYGNYISRVMYAKNAYHEGNKIVVIINAITAGTPNLAIR